MMLFYKFFVWCFWRQNRFIFDQQLSNEPKNIKPKTTFIRIYRGYIYLKLGYTNFFRALYVNWTQFYTQLKYSNLIG